MINISFDRPLLLLIIVPLLALILIPFFIAIRKSNCTKGVIVSLVLHVLIASAVTLVAAGAHYRETVTETQVVVLADASYSSEHNLDLVDEYVRSVEGALPENSKMSVVAFGKDVKRITDFGDDFTTVRASGVDSSETDIKSALEYAEGLFGEGVVKRIVLITDGKETAGFGHAGVVSAIEMLYDKGIYVDAVYVDNNLGEEDREVQLTSVDVTPSTYLHRETTADVLLQSSTDGANARVTLYRDGVEVSTQYAILTRGYNVLNFNLPTNEAGIFEYTVSVSADGIDTSLKNNEYSFVQEVSGRIRVLLITGNEGDLARAEELYGENAEITCYFDDPAIPCTVEELIFYDEIVLSDVDVRELDNITSFLDAVDTVVSRYGKSLLTFGDLKIQNQTDDTLKDLQDMLPVRYGNNEQDPKHVCIVVDISRSMEFNYKLDMAKAASKQILSIMDDKDSLTIVCFWGDYTTPWPTTPIEGQRELIESVIDAFEPTQGTMLDAGLREAYDKISASSIEKQQVFLISDGRSWANEEDGAITTAEELAKLGVPVSVLNVGTKVQSGDDSSGAAVRLLESIAEVGDGSYYFAESITDLNRVILAEISDDVTESVIETTSPVFVKIPSDSVLSSGFVPPSVDGFVYAKAKDSAKTVLTTEFTKAKGGITEPPIYSYWSYGRGNVSSFTSSLSSKWTSEWQSGQGAEVIRNIFDVNIPKSKHSYPFTLELTTSGGETVLSMIPDTLKYDATASIRITYPDGTVAEEPLDFSSDGYYFEFASDTVGTYVLETTYSLSSREYSATTFMTVPYLDEYDSFTVFSVADLHKIIRNRGSVFEGVDGLVLENREEDVATFILYLTVPLMIAAVSLYVVDVIIRKLRWTDIRNLFGMKERKKQRSKGAKQ